MSDSAVVHHLGPVLDRRDLIWLSLASALLAAGAGASYAFIDLSLNRMGASATAIGLSGAMPALGWFLGTPLMPWALRRFRPAWLLGGLLVVAVAATLAYPLWPHSTAWLGLRFLSGGCVGLVFRVVEYWVGAASPDSHRARNIGVYSAAFAGGAMIGVAVFPLVGLAGWPPLLMTALLYALAGLAFIRPRVPPPAVRALPRLGRRLLAGSSFLAISGALIYGLFEAVPYTLMPVYTVRVGQGEDLAAWTASAFLAGSLLFSVPMGLIADRLGKVRVIVVSAGFALIIGLIVPNAVGTPWGLLALMALWGGASGALYTVTLAILPDHFDGAELAGANAAFGTVYAFGSLCGPLLHGTAMDWRDPQGLMISAALLFSLFLLCAFWHSVRRGWGKCARTSN